MKLLVRHPRSYPRERDYILDVVLTEFLGVEFDSIPEDRDDVELALETGTGERVRLPDIAFDVPDENWPHSLVLPTHPLGEFRDPWVREVLGVDSVPILYGRPGAAGSYLEQTSGTLTLGVDVFGAAFVLLSRIEELGESQRDAHGRFPSSASLAVAHGFLDRPLVDEYVELLRSALDRVFPGLTPRRPGYAVDPSHDIDFVDGRKAGVGGQLRASARDLLRDRSPLLAARRAVSVPLRPLLGSRVDVFNTFAELMQNSEEIGVRSTFFFICGRAPGGLDDDNYELDEPWVTATLRSIVERGHRVGLHGSYLSSGSAEQLTSERIALEKALAAGAVAPLSFGCRQHFLRLDPARTWPAQEAAGLAYDASSGYADKPGFRSGTCREHHLFHITERRPLRLRERPLVLMDATLLDANYLSLGVEPALRTAEHIARGCRRVGGTFTVLWHNTRLLTPAHRSLYREILAC